MPSRQAINTTAVLSFTSALALTCLLIWFRLPVRDMVQNEINTKILIKQHQHKRWAHMPGDLGYMWTRSLHLFQGDANMDKEYRINYHMERDFEDIEYVHIQSVVDYTEKYSFMIEGDSSMMTDKINTFNLGALSTWYQLEHRPDFLKAFKALTQLKKLYLRCDPYGRYFAHNIWLMAYKDKAVMKSSVLSGISDSDANILMDDPVYGIGTGKGTLYRWVKAMNEGP